MLHGCCFPAASQSGGAAPSWLAFQDSDGGGVGFTRGFGQSQGQCRLRESAQSKKWRCRGSYRRCSLSELSVRSEEVPKGLPKCKGNVGCFIGEEKEQVLNGNGAQVAIERDRQLDASSSSSSSDGAPRPRPLPRRRWEEMTTVDFESMDARSTIAILPVAAIEQHGPHLPLSTDAAINEGILRRALEMVDAALPVTVLPAMPVGKSNEHLAYPGTLSLRARTLIALWTDIGASVARAGVRKLVLFNSHGGQPQIMDIVARELRVQHGMLVVALTWFNFGIPDNLFPEHELRHGIHGGSIETSIMLHLHPSLVRTDQLRNFVSLSEEMERDGYKLMTPEGRVGFGWQMQDLHEAGVCGNALDADAERGRRIVEFAAGKLAELLVEVHRYPLENIKQRRSPVAMYRDEAMTATRNDLEAHRAEVAGLEEMDMLAEKI